MNEEYLNFIDEIYGKPYADLCKKFYELYNKKLIVSEHLARDNNNRTYEQNMLFNKNYDYYSTERRFDFSILIEDYTNTLRFYTTKLPGSCGILVIHSFALFIYMKAFLDFFVEIAKFLGFSQIMITHSQQRYEQDFIEYGFKKVSDTLNRRSGNKIQVYLYNI